MTFIASHHDRRNDRVLVWEKTESGKRIVREYDAPYYFFAPDKDGTYEAITGERLKRVDCRNKRDFEEEVLRYPRRFESDLHPLEKVMMDNYCGKKVPQLTIGFVDIEVNYDPKIGFASPENPYAPINALTLYRSDINDYFTLAVAPPGFTGRLPEEMEATQYFLLDSEATLLSYFLDLLEEVDVVSGWNSEFYDLPYIGKRVEMIFGPNGLKRMAFERGQTPRWGERERFKNSSAKDIVLILDSRVHLDYMLLFKKFNLEGRPSFALAAIAEAELEIDKLKYEGTLRELYHDNFVKFLEYNRRDTEILVKLNEKFKYIELANAMVHEATVNFNAIFGSVQLIDTAIMNYAHSKKNKILFDRKGGEKKQVEGALVMTPKPGLKRWIGICDINSLYPSTYRSLNLSPEKIVAQLLGQEEDWKRVHLARKFPNNDMYKLHQVNMLLEGESDPVNVTVGELIEMLEREKLAISAHGTILDQGHGEGLLPEVLSYWFLGRKEMQAKKKEYLRLADELAEKHGDKNHSEVIEAKKQADYYDMLQGVRKVLLNSAYGATLNPYCRFYDQRLGSSTTDTGRYITTHMIETIAEILLGANHPRVKKIVEINKKTGEAENKYTIESPDGLGPFYSDTDSCHFTVADLVNNLEEAIPAIDAIVDQVNASFQPFMIEAFMCQPEFSDKIRAVREMVNETGIFRAKKKYLYFVKDKEGRLIDPDDEKALYTKGSDIALSSTPAVVKEFLKTTTMMVLKSEPKTKIDELILEFRKKIKSDPNFNVLDFATITSVKSLDEYVLKWERIEKPGLGRVNMPAAPRGVINHNTCLELFDDKLTLPIMSGQKIKMVWLKENAYGYTNMAFSSDLDQLPEWFFKNFEIDVEATETKMIDNTIKKIFDPLGWQVPTPQSVAVQRLLSFD